MKSANCWLENNIYIWLCRQRMRRDVIPFSAIDQWATVLVYPTSQRERTNKSHAQETRGTHRPWNRGTNRPWNGGTHRSCRQELPPGKIGGKLEKKFLPRDFFMGGIWMTFKCVTTLPPSCEEIYPVFVWLEKRYLDLSNICNVGFRRQEMNDM